MVRREIEEKIEPYKQELVKKFPNGMTTQQLQAELIRFIQREMIRLSNKLQAFVYATTEEFEKRKSTQKDTQGPSVEIIVKYQGKEIAHYQYAAICLLAPNDYFAKHIGENIMEAYREHLGL